MGKTWPKDSKSETTPAKKIRTSSPQRYRLLFFFFLPHKSFMEALRTDYPPSPFRQPFLLSTLWSHPCAKNYQYLLNVSHKAWPCTGRSCRGLTGEGIRHWRGINEMPRAISLRVSKDSRCSGTRNPRGPPSSEFHQRSGEGTQPRPPPAGRAGWRTW